MLRKPRHRDKRARLRRDARTQELENRILLTRLSSDLTHVGSDLVFTERVIVEGDIEINVIGGGLVFEQGITGDGDGSTVDALEVNIFDAAAGDTNELRILGDVGGFGFQSFTAKSTGGITVGDGIAITLPGDFTLTTDAGVDLTTELLNPLFEDKSATTQIHIGEAEIVADDIVLTSTATTSKFLDFDIYDEGLPALITGNLGRFEDASVQITFADSAGNAATISRPAGGSWLDDGFQAGDVIKIIGEGFDGSETLTIDTITPTVITLIESDVLENQTKSGIVIEQAFTSLLPEDVPVSVFDRAGTRVDLDISSGLVSDYLLLQGADILGGILPTPFEAMSVDSLSEIIVSPGASLTAERDIRINVTSSAEASIGSPSLVYGQVHGRSDATANASIGTGAIINAGSVFELTSTVNNTLDVDAKVRSGLLKSVAGKLLELPGAKFAIATGHAESVSDAIVESDASITAGTVLIQSTNNNSFSVVSDAAGKPGKALGAAVGVTVADFTSNSRAEVHGDVHTTGSVEIKASTENAQEEVQSESVVKKSSGPRQKLQAKLKSLVMDSRAKPKQLDLAAGVSIVDSVNDASAIVSGTATITAGTTIDVAATSETNFRNNAVGTAKSGAAKVGLGGAVAVSNQTNSATAEIADDAEVNANGAITVDADAIIPIQVETPGDRTTLSEIFDGGLISTSIDTSSALTLVESLDSLTTEFGLVMNKFGDVTNLGFPDNIATTFAHAGAKSTGDDGKFALSGAVNILDIENTANARVGKRAKINQAPTLVPSEQSVTVDAEASIETVNMGGVPSLKNLPLTVAKNKGLLVPDSKSDGHAVGGTYLGLSVENAATAFIDDRAMVSADDGVTVESTATHYTVGLVESGGQADEFGVQGGAAVHNVTNTSRAYIEDEAAVVSGNNVAVDAHAHNKAIIVAGTFVKAGNVGVGASLGINDFSNTVEAFIGDANGVSGSPGSIDLSGDLKVEATSDQRLVSVSIAAAINPGESQDDSDEDQSITDIARSGSADDVKQSSGIGISGDVALNELTDKVHAYIADDVVVTATGDVDVHADAMNRVTAVAGAVSLDLTKANGGIAIAGAFANNDISHDVQAFVRDADITADDVTAIATTADTLTSVAAGGAGSRRKGTVAVAGSVDLNQIDNTTLAGFWGDSVIDAAGSVTTRASDTLDVVSVAGGLAFTGQVGVGAAADLAFFDRDVRATIESNASVDAEKDVIVEAKAEEDLVSIGASVAIATKALGVSGSASAQNQTTNVEASVGGDVTAGDLVDIDAINTTSLVSVGGSVGVGKTAAFGGGVAINNLDRDVLADIGDDASVTGLGRGVHVHANATDSFSLIAGAGAGAKTGAFAASAVVNLVDSEVEALIGDGALINQAVGSVAPGQSVLVGADHSSDYLSVAGSFAGAKTAGIGAGADIETIDKRVTASIGDAAIVDAKHNISVTAMNSDEFLLIGAAAAGGTTAGVSGSATVVTLDTTTHAWLGDNATAIAGGSVQIAADSTADFTTVAGNLGYGGTAGVGASNSTIVKTDSTKAWIGDHATGTGQGAGTAITVPTPDVIGGIRQQEEIHGISVTATSIETMLTIAGAGQGGGTAGIAASAVVNILDETTEAWISEDARINVVENVNPSVDQRVSLLASDHTEILSIAGAIGGGGTVGAGAGADVGTIDKSTKAFIASGANVAANEHVLVRADSNEDIFSVSASIGGAGTVGIAGAANVYTLNNTTHAHVNDSSASSPTEVHAAGTVVIDASNSTELDLIAGNISGAGTVNVGATAGVALIDKNTSARIGSQTSVNAAQANRGDLLVSNGQISTTRVGQGAASEFEFPETDADGNIVDSARNLDREVGLPDPIETDLTEDGVSDIDDSALTTERQVQVGEELFSGVSVTATNLDDIDTITANGGGAGTVAVNASGAVTITDIYTEASVGMGANIDSGKAVQVRSTADLQHMGISAALSIAGTAAATPSADVTSLQNTTFAFIANEADVTADKDVTVTAANTQSVTTIAAAVSGGLVGSLAGAATYVNIDNTTNAYIGADAGDASMAPTVSAGGNVVVRATDDTGTFNVTGALGLAVKIAGVGGSVSVLNIEKDTEAFIGRYTEVDALANTDTIDINLGNGASQTARGVIVEASSSEDIENYALAGGFGLIAGLGGGVTIQNVESDTTAFVGVGARVNLNEMASPHGDQSVRVYAVNDVDATTIAGGVAGGVAALAGGVDIGVIRNDTAAYFDTRANVEARGDVDVVAIAPRNIATSGFSGSLAGLALTASVSVWTLGTEFDPTYAFDEFDFEEGTTTTQTENMVPAAELSNVTDYVEDRPLQYDSLLGGYSNTDTNGSDSTPDNTQLQGNALRSAGSRIDSAFDSGQTLSTLDATGADAASGTTAFTGNRASINAGGHVAVLATEPVAFDAIAGTASLSGIGLGGSIIITNINSQTNAHIGSGNQIAAGSGSEDRISVRADYSNRYDGFALAGVVGAVAGLGAQVVVVNDSSSQQAFIDARTEIAESGGGVLVEAVSQRVTEIDVSGGGLSLLGAVGASVGSIEFTGATHAFTRGVDTAGAGPVSAFDIGAISTNTVTVDSIAVGGGIGIGLSGAVINVEVSPNVLASAASDGFASDAELNIDGDLEINAVLNKNVTLDATGIGAGLVAGASAVLADVTATGSVKAELAQDTQADNVTVQASGSDDISVETTAGAGGGLLAGGGTRGSTTIGTDIDAILAANTSVMATDDVLLDATSAADAYVKTKGISVGAGLSVGISLAEATIESSVDAVSSADVEAGDGIFVRAKHNTNNAGVPTTDRAEAVATASGGALLGGNGAIPTATSLPTVAARSTGAVQATGDVTVDALSHSEAVADAGGLTIGLILGVGVSKATAEASGTTIAELDGSVGSTFANTTGARDLQVRAFANADADAVASPSGGGLIGFNGGTATATASPTIETLFSPFAVQTTRDTTVLANALSNARTDVDGSTGGLVGVGNTRATSLTAPQVSITNFGGDVRSGRDIKFEATHNYRNGTTDESLKAHASATPSGGGAGAFVVAKPKATSRADVATNVAADLVAVGDIAVNALSYEAATVVGDGEAYGGVGVAKVDGTALSGGDTTVSFGGTVETQPDAPGAETFSLIADSKTFADSDVTASAGGIVSGTAVESWAATTPKARANVADATINVRDDVIILSNITTTVDSIGRGTDAGGITIGDSDGWAIANTANQARTFASDITAANDIRVTSQTARNVGAQAVGSGKGLASISRGNAIGFLATGKPDDADDDERFIGAPTDRDSSTYTLFDGGVMIAGGEVRVQSLNRDQVLTAAFTDGRGLGAGTDATAITSGSSTTTTRLRDDPEIEAPSIVILAAPTHKQLAGSNRGFIGDAYAETFAGGAGTNADATAANQISLSALVDINDASLTGTDRVHIQTLFDDIDTKAEARARSTSLGGDTDGGANNVSVYNSMIDVDIGSEITTADLLVEAGLLDVSVDVVVERDGGLIDFGDSQVLQAVVADREIHFDADVVLLGAAALNVDANGNVTNAENITIQDSDGHTLGPVASSTIIVNPISGAPPRRVRFYVSQSPFDDRLEAVGYPVRAKITGTPRFRNAQASVHITNESNKPLRLRKIDANAVSGTRAVLDLDAPDTSGANFDRFRDPFRTGGVIDITSSGSGDVTLTDQLTAEMVVVSSMGGDVRTTGSGEILAPVVVVTSQTGHVGSSGTPFVVRPLAHGAIDEPDITINGAEGVVGTLRTSGNLAAGSAYVDVSATASSGDVNLQLLDGDPTDYRLKYLSAAGDIMVMTSDAPSMPIDVEVTGRIESPNGTTTIHLKEGTTGGNILNRAHIYGNGNHLIIAKDVYLEAEYGRVGRVNNPIRVQLTGGEVNADAFNRISIEGVGTPLSVGRMRSPSGVNLYTEDSPGAGDDIYLGPNADIESRYAILNSGDTILIDPNSRISADNGVSFGLENNDADPGVGVTFRLDRWFDVSAIGINSFRDDDNQLFVDNVPDGRVLRISLYGGEDTVVIGSEEQSLANIEGDVTIFNAATPAPGEVRTPKHSLQLIDASYASATTYSMTDRSLSRPGIGNIDFHQYSTFYTTTAPLKFVELQTGSGANQIDFSATEPDMNGVLPGTASFSIKAGASDDQITVRSTQVNSELNIDTGSGTDRVHIEGQNLFGDVSIEGDSTLVNYTAPGLSVTPTEPTTPAGTIQAEARAAVSYSSAPEVTGETFIDIALTGENIAENAAAGSVIGTLSAVATDETPVYTLLDSAGGRFEIVGTELRTALALDFEAASSHNILIGMQVGGVDYERQFTISVLDVNEAPTLHDLQLTPSPGIEGSSIVLSGRYEDPDANDSQTVQIAWGDGSVSEAIIDAETLTFEATHIFKNDNGGPAFVGAVTISDFGGLTVSDSLPLPVLNAAPEFLGTFSAWTSENAASEAGTWEIGPNQTVIQDANVPAATVLYSDYELFSRVVSGTVVVNETEGDNDFFGFVLGFNPGDLSSDDADYLLLDWKQESQTLDDTTAIAGLALSRVTGETNFESLWAHTGSVQEVARAETLGSTGWNDNEVYEFRLEYSSDRLRVFVNGVKEFDVAARDNRAFPNGRLGLYALSQQSVQFSGFAGEAIADNEANRVSVRQDFVDPGQLDSHTATIDWGDGTSTVGTITSSIVAGQARGTVSGEHVYADDGDYNIVITLNDDGNGSDTLALDTTIRNVRPNLTLGDNQAIDEGGFITLGPASFFDPGFDIASLGTTEDFEAFIDWGDGTVEPLSDLILVDNEDGEFGSPTTGTIDGSHAYADNGGYTVTVGVRDDDMPAGEWVTGTFEVIVSNVAPMIDESAVSIGSATCGGAREGDTISFSALFSDPGFSLASAGTEETFAATTIAWGDGTVDTVSDFDLAVQNGSEGAATIGSINASHTYESGGIYTITLTVRDDDGASHSVETTAQIIGAGVVNGVLYVVGTDERDYVNVRVDEVPGMIQVDARLDQTNRTDRRRFEIDRVYDGSEVDSIMITACGGNDYFAIRHAKKSEQIIPSTIYGGTGNDFLRGGNGDDFVDGGAGDDTISTIDGRDEVIDLIGDNTIRTGRHHDTVTTGDGDDYISTGSGHDKVHAGHGQNTVTTAGGNDEVITGDGRDKITTGSGSDFVQSGGDRDRISTGGGKDIVLAGTGKDHVIGGPGHDLIVGGGGDDTLFGSAGMDILIGSGGKDSLNGSSGEDLLIAGATSFDNQVADLANLRDEWVSEGTVSQRIDRLRTGTGSTGLQLASGISVFDDGVKDRTSGGGNVDWFFASLNNDKTNSSKRDLFDYL